MFRQMLTALCLMRKVPLVGVISSLMVACLLFCLLQAPVAFAQEEDVIGITGNFYRQVYEIPQGGSAGGSDTYIVVFNQGQTETKLKMVCEAPMNVSVSFSDEEFVLQPGDNQKVFISINVTEDALPGEYELKVVAEVVKEVGGGIKVASAAGQRAKLIITGASATVEVVTLGPEGEPVSATIRLFKIISGRENEIAASDTGVVEAKVSPGTFVAVAYIAGEELARQSFDISPDEHKRVELIVRSVYFRAFSIVPFYEGNKITYAELTYAIKNLYRNLPEVMISLSVEYQNTPLEERNLATLSILQQGKTELSYIYIPKEGWQTGVYQFRLQLSSKGMVYASIEEVLEVTVKAPPVALGLPLMLIIGIGVAILIAGLLLISRRKKRKAGVES